MIFVLNFYCLNAIWCTLYHFTYGINLFIWNNFLLMFDTLIIFKANYTIMYEYLMKSAIVGKYFFQIVIYVRICYCIIRETFWDNFYNTKYIYFHFLLCLFCADYYKDYYSFILQDWSENSFFCLLAQKQKMSDFFRSICYNVIIY